MYKVFSLYHGVGSARYAPHDFTATPTLEDYLNYLAEKGYRTVSVFKDDCWYTIVTEKNQ